ncbi:DUF4136 domain-containing protein [Chitinophaga caeni]|nr:DUF4136 domain-containing protein [Chitinophaga caeni]
MKRILILTIVITAALLYSCSSTRVLQHEGVDGFSINQYKTYQFYEIDSTAADSSNMENYKKGIAMLEDAISKQLATRGLTRTSNNPDLLVNIGLVVNEKIQTRQTDFRTDAPRYMGQRRYSWKSEEVEVGRYKEGTVNIHLVDPKSEKLLWQGTVSDVITKKSSSLPAQADKAMEALFSKLP